LAEHNQNTSARPFDQAFERVNELVMNFHERESYYLSSDYPESQARIDFIDKFWIANGWDVNHEKQSDPYRQEVKVERNVIVPNERRKRADYTFLAPNFRDVSFFVEAKKPQRSLKTEENYFQTIRYGWNGGTPLAVLTDFEEFHILDCRYKPDPSNVLDKLVKQFHYSEYLDKEKFSEIYFLFSREAVASRALERFAESHLKPVGKAVARTLFGGGNQRIDESFLQELDTYRESLAGAFKDANPNLDSTELTEVTQRVLDRLVFMRFLEDKLIETEPIVENLGVHSTTWVDFVSTSHRLDHIYNGIIFKRHRLLDAPDFRVNEPTFAAIREDLAHLNTPYDFNTIPIHILGSIYERFLGKTISVSDNKVKIEPKPEVRKAGGVYYTPEFIVRYVVDNTIGALIKNKTPEQIREMRFGDIACGSGSFLLDVYDLLLRHHTAYYNKKVNRAKGLKIRCIEREDGTLQLSLWQKREILLNNIYGMDVDAQAVEVAQLSLCLKLLEDETTLSTHKHQLAFRDALLPNLSKNIVCGNSLIDWDIRETTLFQGEDERRLNPISFESAFPEVMKQGGFDAIVGNPPYIRIQALKEISPAAADYYKAHYLAASQGNYDIYVLFVERALGLLNRRGLLGYILPHKFLNSKYGSPLRSKLAAGKYLSQLVHFGDQQVFADAKTYTCLLFLDKAGRDEFEVIKVSNLAAWRLDEGGDVRGTVDARKIDAEEWTFVVGPGAKLFDKLHKLPQKLGDVTSRIFQGLITSADPVFLFKDFRDADSVGEVEIFSQELQQWRSVEERALKPVIRSGSIHRFRADSTARILFPYNLEQGSARLLSPEELQRDYPLTWSYLNENKKALESREGGKFQDSQWYRFGRSQNLGLWEQPKIMVPYMITELGAYLDLANNYYFINVTTGGYGITMNDAAGSLAYLCALLNSPLLDFYFKQVSTNFVGGYFAANKQYIEQLPIRTIDFSNSADKRRHDRIVDLVSQIQSAKENWTRALADRDVTFYENKSDSLYREINQLVYELYSLNDREIAFVGSLTSSREILSPVKQGVLTNDLIRLAVRKMSSELG
jgi:type I restriction-modification system DNA methylase subunit